MKSGSEGLVASSEAYEVLRAIAEEIGSENNIVDLELFSFNMDRSCGHPVDPAFESEWGFYWGPAVALSPEDSFRVAVQFMNFELGWTKNVLLREFMKEAEKSAREPESAPAGLLWTAITSNLPAMPLEKNCNVHFYRDRIPYDDFASAILDDPAT